MSNEINCNDPIAIITQVLDYMEKEQAKNLTLKKSILLNWRKEPESADQS